MNTNSDEASTPDSASVKNAINNLKNLKKRIINTKELIKLYDASQATIAELKKENETIKSNGQNNEDLQRELAAV